MASSTLTGSESTFPGPSSLPNPDHVQIVVPNPFKNVDLSSLPTIDINGDFIKTPGEATVALENETTLQALSSVGDFSVILEDK